MNQKIRYRLENHGTTVQLPAGAGQRSWIEGGSGWESFDAAIGSFDSTHLAFGVSYDGNPMNHYAAMKLSREMTLTQAARVVPRKVAKD